MGGTEPIGCSVPEPARLLLIDDYEFIRVGVRTLCAELRGVPVEWLEADNLRDGMALYQQHGDIDAVLLDLNLADCKGLQGLRQFMEAFPAAQVVVFSGTQDEFVIRQARALGARGYIRKTGAAEDLTAALAALLPGDERLGLRRSGGLSSVMFPHMPGSAVFDRIAELGPRHLEVLELVLSGCTNQEISAATGLSLGTVKNYVSSLLLALDVKSRSHLISLFR
ncbi:response regulator transcription factor [Sphaerotilus sp.]|uniref:response regulator transcription factor n=1 Tax=Sphaerotilus sp. TaxID=2093942 RepID=UPI002ACD373A|nr:response regulator transcription factor [Sphaerotilus sp.]